MKSACQPNFKEVDQAWTGASQLFILGIIRNVRIFWLISVDLLWRKPKKHQDFQGISKKRNRFFFFCIRNLSEHGWCFFLFHCTHCLKIQRTCSDCFIRHLSLLLLLWCDCFVAGFELLGSCLKGETQRCVAYNSHGISLIFLLEKL